MARALAVLCLVAPAETRAQDASVLVKPELEVPDTPSAIGAPVTNELQVPSGGRALAIKRIQDIPKPLEDAAKRAQCQVAEHLLTNHPVLIFRPADGYRVMALVPCHAIVPFSRAFLFEQSPENEPVPMTFPVVAPNGGISASSQPGLMTWDAQTRTLVAWRGNDSCPARELRHTYRQVGGELNGFALTRIEQRMLRCTTPESDWQALWQSPAWNLQP
jgi:hypothetical protein